jgi:hypothetical protein
LAARVLDKLMAFYEVRTNNLAIVERLSRAPIMSIAAVSESTIRVRRGPVIALIH